MALLAVGILVTLAAAASGAELCDFKRGYDVVPAVHEAAGVGIRRLHGDPLGAEALGAFPSSRLFTKEIFSQAALRGPAFANDTGPHQPNEKTVTGLLLRLQKSPEASAIPPTDLVISKYYDLLGKPPQSSPFFLVDINRFSNDLEPQLAGSAGYHSKFSLSDVINSFQFRNNTLPYFESSYRYNPYAWPLSGNSKVNPLVEIPQRQDDMLSRNRLVDSGQKGIHSKEVAFTWPFFGFPRTKSNGSAQTTTPKLNLYPPESSTSTSEPEVKKIENPQRIIAEKQYNRITTPPVELWRRPSSYASRSPSNFQEPVNQSRSQYSHSPNNEQVTIKIIWTSNSSSMNPNTKGPYGQKIVDSPTTKSYTWNNVSQPWNTVGTHPTPAGQPPPNQKNYITPAPNHTQPIPGNSSSPPFRIPTTAQAEIVELQSTVPYQRVTIQEHGSTPSSFFATSAVSVNEDSTTNINPKPVSQNSRKKIKYSSTPIVMSDPENKENNGESAFIDEGISDEEFSRSGVNEETHFRAPSSVNNLLLTPNVPKEQYIDAFFKSLNVNAPVKGIKNGILQPLSSSKDEDEAWSYRETNSIKTDNLMSRYSGKSNSKNLLKGDSLISHYSRKPLPAYSPKVSNKENVESSSVAFHHAIPINQLLSERKTSISSAAMERPDVEKPHRDYFLKTEENSQNLEFNRASLPETKCSQESMDGNQNGIGLPQQLSMDSSVIGHLKKFDQSSKVNGDIVHRASANRNKGFISLFKYGLLKKDPNDSNLSSDNVEWNAQINSKDTLNLSPENEETFVDPLQKRIKREILFKKENDQNILMSEGTSNSDENLSPSAAGLMRLGERESTTHTLLESKPSEAEILSRLEGMAPFDHKIMQLQEQCQMKNKPRLQVVHSGPNAVKESATLYPVYPVYPVFPINSIILTSSTDPDESVA